MEQQELTIDGFTFSYVRIGKGNKGIISFNGYEKTAIDFAENLLETEFPHHYTILCVDLFFHGKTIVPQKRVEKNQITPSELHVYIQKILTKENLVFPHLFGFSMGGKIALSLFSYHPEEYGNLYLLAPEGLKPIWWYGALASFPPFRSVYKYYIHHPYWYFFWMDLIKKIGLLSKSAVEFANEKMATPERRKFLYDVWMSIKKLKPSFPKLQTIPALEDRIQIFVGSKDRVVRATKAYEFCKNLGLNPKKVVKEFDAGHSILKPQYLREIPIK
ncbi:alpha/beta fold hydrolase [Luteibaculum oceani]|uniref:alpha/beta fold hydrolase n=1 Tax=Luteibaculum oceani TaxID=1294296 RepID=UPI00147748CC|nr:alpha/beta hydrolase [Luteibaculum oceani]